MKTGDKFVYRVGDTVGSVEIMSTHVTRGVPIAMIEERDDTGYIGTKIVSIAQLDKELDLLAACLVPTETISELQLSLFG